MHRDSLAERLLKAERGLRSFKPADSATSGFDPVLDGATQAMHAALDQVAEIILGKERQIRLTLACLLARGHLLIEDLPGVGKTTLAHAIARSLGMQFQRIQFTSDLLPADIIGVSIFDSQHGGFRFHPGPIFAQMILADEVNRATPKAQSALLEAMEEQQVTTEGETRALPQPFFVMATQNPSHQVGTFPLPESQLDRFLMCIRLGYPDAQAERRLLEGSDRRDLVASLPPRLTPDQLLSLQQAARSLHVAPALLDYLQAILAHSRQTPEFATGLSPRAGLNVLHAARAWALLDGRNFVIPEDVQAVLPSVVAHRLQPSGGQRAVDAADAVRRLLSQVAIP
jgi:MoxR-like ATPase